MSFFEIFIVAIALGVDAFACSLVSGSFCKSDKKRLAMAFKYALTFAFFQFVMPLIGFIGGENLLEYISSFDHWVSFLLLAVVAFNMIKEAFSKEDEKTAKDSIFWLLSLGVATSIDALAVGLSLIALDNRIFYISSVIGIVCFFMSLTGVLLGGFLATKFEKLSRYMNCAGALVLLYIGIEVLIEHGVF